MSTIEYHSSGSHRGSTLKQREAWTFVISSMIGTWIQRQRKRNEYAQLLRYRPDILEDIGVTKAQLQKQARKPFWRA